MKARAETAAPVADDTPAVSMLMASARVRVLGASGLVALLWVAVAWARWGGA